MRYVALFLSLVTTTLALGQEAAPPQSTLARWLAAWQAKGLSVRQTFDGSKNESKPASIAYLKPLYTADIGVKFLEFDPLKNSVQQTMPIGPSIEWHRTNTPKASNTLAAKLNADWSIGQLKGFNPDGTERPNPTGVPQHTTGVLITIKPGATRDNIAEKIGNEDLLAIMLISNKNYYPGALTVDHDNRHLFRYLPSVGMEYYGNKNVFDGHGVEQQGAELAFARARLFLVTYLFNRDKQDRNELNADYTYRWRVGGQTVLGNTHLLSTQFTHYFDKKRTIGVGLTYDHGRDPTQKFQDLKQGKIALRLSL
jgi:hypothetical protein